METKIWQRTTLTTPFFETPHGQETPIVGIVPKDSQGSIKKAPTILLISTKCFNDSDSEFVSD